MNTAWRVDGGTLRRHLLVGAVAALLVMAAAAPARAQAADGFQIDIPIIQGISAPEGSLTQIGPVIQVPEENLGERCLVTAHTQNQNSVHPGNDLIVESGSSQVVIPNVEAESDLSIDGEGILVLGPTIDVALHMGPDEAFSAGIIVEIDCTVFRFGQIIVEKAVPEGVDAGGQIFDFTASYSDTGFPLEADGSNNSGDLRPGTYTVAENVPDGWTLGSLECGGDSTVDLSSASAEIDLKAYETVTCTFTNVPEQVMAAIVVGVDTTCRVVDENPEGEVNVSVSVNGGATVVVRDSDGDVVATVTDDATIDAEPGATYTWEATPSEGFEFPPGSATSGSVTVEDCVASLPFTGADTELLLALSFLFVGSGLIILRLTREGRHI